MELDELALMAQALIAADEAVEKADTELKAKKEKARILREETLPGAMQELGVTEFKLDSGQRISVRQEVYAQIPAASKGAAFQWLRDHGFDGLIKTGVTTEFGRGESEEAAKLLERLHTEGFINASLKEDVHPQTLKAFLKEQINAGGDDPVPLDLFGARPVFTAKISK